MGRLRQEKRNKEYKERQILLAEEAAKKSVAAAALSVAAQSNSEEVAKKSEGWSSLASKSADIAVSVKKAGEMQDLRSEFKKEVADAKKNLLISSSMNSSAKNVSEIEGGFVLCTSETPASIGPPSYGPPRITGKKIEKLPELTGDVALIAKFGGPTKIMESLGGILRNEKLDDVIVNMYLASIQRESDKRFTSNQEFPRILVFDSHVIEKIMKQIQHGLARFEGTASNNHFHVNARCHEGVNVFEYDLWLLPIFQNSHWALAVLDLVAVRLELWDSCAGSIDLTMLRYLMRALIRCQWEGCMGALPIPEKLKFPRISQLNCSKQTNSIDCGVFLLEFCAMNLDRPSGVSLQEVQCLCTRRSTHQIQLKGRAKIYRCINRILSEYAVIQLLRYVVFAV